MKFSCCLFCIELILVQQSGCNFIDERLKSNFIYIFHCEYCSLQIHVERKESSLLTNFFMQDLVFALEYRMTQKKIMFLSRKIITEKYAYGTLHLNCIEFPFLKSNNINLLPLIYKALTNVSITSKEENEIVLSRSDYCHFYKRMNCA